MDFIKYNKVVDIKIDENGRLILHRIQKLKKFSVIWAYSLEELTFDFKQKILDLKTIPLKKCSMLPIGGIEVISYSAFYDMATECEKTLYTKSLEMKGALSKFTDKINDSFTSGCKIVEENCEKFKEMAL